MDYNDEELKFILTYIPRDAFDKADKGNLYYKIKRDLFEKQQELVVRKTVVYDFKRV